MEAKVTAVCKESEPEAAALVDGAWRALDADLLRIFPDHLREFLRTHEIARDVSGYVPEAAGRLSLSGVRGGTGDRIESELGGFAGDMTANAADVGTLVVAAVHLHLVVLLAVAHPILALSESRMAEKLGEGRVAARRALKQKILESLTKAGGKDGLVASAARAFDAMIAQAVADLGVLEELAKVLTQEARAVSAV